MESKRALVTGAAFGIGRAIATKLAAEGVHVICLDIDAEGAKAIAAEIGGTPWAANLEQPGVISAVIPSHWPLDYLVNNAGIMVRTSLTETKIEDWDRLMAINLRAPFLLSQAFAQAAIRDKRPGHIVNVSSGHAVLSGFNRTAYAAAKAGIESLTRNCALELGRDSILVNAVAPGFTFTEMSRQSLVGNRLQAVEERLPIHRVGEASEVANAVWTLLSGQLSYITGQVLRIDGGWSNSDVDYAKFVDDPRA